MPTGLRSKMPLSVLQGGAAASAASLQRFSQESWLSPGISLHALPAKESTTQKYDSEGVEELEEHFLMHDFEGNMSVSNVSVG